jgi:hypothetical protein
MYLVIMDQLAREDITAAAAVQRELGREYDDAVAESLIERIGAEIDKWVDARLGQPGAGLAPPAVPAAPRRAAVQPGQAARPSWTAVVLGLGSLGLGIGASAAVLNVGTGTITGPRVGAGQVLLVVLIWVVIGIMNVSYSRRH